MAEQKEPMFDKDSFGEEITTPEEASACVLYLAQNEYKFRTELKAEGLTYDQVVAEVTLIWTNLLKSCKRVGYSDHITEIRADRYDITV